MKKIGLIGGTGPESTLVYYRDLRGHPATPRWSVKKLTGGSFFYRQV